MLDAQGMPYRLRDTPAATMKGLMMLDTVDEDVDDVELAYWAAVEDTTHVDDDDSAVTSPLWVKVEELMGCKLRLSNILVTLKGPSFRSISVYYFRGRYKLRPGFGALQTIYFSFNRLYIQVYF